MSKKRISVIGAGLGGLAVSCLLASKGHEVTIFEKNDNPGGKINQLKINGYKFDTGPSLLTMPFILERLFDEVNKNLEDYINICPVEPICKYFYKDGQIFYCYQNHEKNLEQIREFAPQDEEAYNNFLKYSASLYQKTKDAFLENPLYNWSDLVSMRLTDVLRIDAFKTVAERVDNTFTSPYLQQFFKRFSTYNGSSPYQAPATLNVIPHVELSLGGYYINGGMYNLIKGLKKLAGELDVEIRYNREIKKIEVQNGKACALVDINKNQFDSDIIISNSDASETYLQLLSDSVVSNNKAQLIEKLEPSCSGFVLLLGVEKEFEQLDHHNIFFSSDYKKEFQQIFKDKVMPDDPTIYVANTSKSNSSHAPDGGSNLFILVNAPYLSDEWDWQINRESYAQKIIQILEERGLEKLSDHIQVEEYITPVDFYKKYRSNKGSIYGTSSNNKLSAFLRPKNKSREIDNLYLVGGSTHPGGGIPLVTLSAFHAAELIERYE
ncbi:MAG: phytoene desaturase family protein [Balneolaceae bacterium]|nr:phytoene desaturase family protein [Balneolaceae bacterium]